MKPAAERVAAFFDSGFVGSCLDAARELNMSKVTVYDAIRILLAAKRVYRVERRQVRYGVVDIFAAPSAPPRVTEQGGNVSIVANAISTRHPLQLWACRRNQTEASTT